MNARAPALALALAAASCSPLAPDAATAASALTLPPGTRIVRTREALVAALEDESFHGTIYIPPDVFIYFNGLHGLPLRDGVTLLSQREGTSDGAWLISGDLPDKTSLFVVRGNNVRVEGLRIQGPSVSHGSSLNARGIQIETSLYRNLVVANNELFAWPGSAVFVVGTYGGDDPEDVGRPVLPPMGRAEAGQVLVAGNYIHHNLRDGLGYGVQVSSGAYATVEGNVFDFNRHAIASDGLPRTGYVAHFNYVLEGGHCEGAADACYFNQHFDVHGTAQDGYGGAAGEYFDISYNTFRGEQRYHTTKIRPALMLRGSPAVGMYFNNNVLVHDNESAAVRLTDNSLWASAFSNVFVGPNRYDLDTSGDLVTGDFDGDGKTDVLLATGTSIFLSSAGVTSWRFLGGSPYRHYEIAAGRFDGDAKDDLFVRAYDGAWYFSSGVTGPLTRINSSNVAMGDLRFGDFNGDGLTDVFRADGQRWLVSWAGRSTWAQVNTSGFRVADLRFGDFDGDGRTDVFSLANGQWSFARGAQGSWLRLNSPLSSDIRSLAFADYDGDGRTDVAQRDASDGWRYSQRGQTPWRQLRTAAGQPQFANPVATLIGDFDGDGTDDALRVDPASRYFVSWSSRRADAFALCSRHEMR